MSSASPWPTWRISSRSPGRCSGMCRRRPAQPLAPDQELARRPCPGNPGLVWIALRRWPSASADRIAGRMRYGQTGGTSGSSASGASATAANSSVLVSAAGSPSPAGLGSSAGSSSSGTSHTERFVHDRVGCAGFVGDGPGIRGVAVVGGQPGVARLGHGAPARIGRSRARLADQDLRPFLLCRSGVPQAETSTAGVPSRRRGRRSSGWRRQRPGRRRRPAVRPGHADRVVVGAL